MKDRRTGPRESRIRGSKTWAGGAAVVLVSAVLLAAGASSASPGEISRTYSGFVVEPGISAGTSYEWIAASVPGSPDVVVATPASYVLRLEANGAVAVRADCNWKAGRYNPAASQLEFGPSLGSPSVCAGQSSSGQFLELLSLAGTPRAAPEGVLTVPLQGGGSMTFRKVSAGQLDAEAAWIAH